MPRSKAVQYRFTRGELDPELQGRSDVDFYYSSAERIRNAFVLPQGSVTRRPGLEYKATLRNTIALATALIGADPDLRNTNSGIQLPFLDDNVITGSNFYTTTTAIGTIDPYVVFRYDIGSLQNVAFFDLLRVKLSTGSTTEFIAQKSDDDISWSNLSSPTETQHQMLVDTTERNYRFAVDDNVRYLRLVKIGGTDLGAAVISLIESDVWIDTGITAESRLTSFEFNDQQAYQMLWTDRNLAVYKDGILQANVTSPYTAQIGDELSVMNYTQSNDVGIFFQENVKPYELIRQGGDNLWTFRIIEFSNIPKHEYVINNTNPATTLTFSGASGIVTATAAAATFTGVSDVGKYISGEGGRARIIKFTSTTVVTVFIEIPFFSNVLASGTWVYEKGWEDLWSDARGFPRCGTFYRGRLLMAGFKSRPATLVASAIDDIFNYDLGTLLADEAFDITIDSDKANVIYHLVSHDNLEIFTNNSEIVIKTDETFSPTGKTKFSRQSSQGTKLEIRPDEIENGGTIYVQKGGKSVSEFIFSDTVLAYTNNKLSLVSSHLLNDVIDASLRGDTSTEEASYYSLVNAGGQLIVATILKEQEVIAFSEQITDGNFKNVIAVVDDIYCVVERTINGATVRYFEKLTFDRKTDASKYLLASDSSIDGTKYATASITPSAPNGGTAADVNDGSLITFLTTTVSISTTDNYVAFSFDLGSNQSVDYIDLQLLSITAGSTNEFQIEYSTDNFSSDINAASKIINLTTTAGDFEIPIGASTRYIRLIRNGTTDLGTAKISIAEGTVHLDKSVTVSGLDYLEGKSVWTIIDGSAYGPETIVSGSITLDKEPQTDLEIGLDYDVTIKTNPVESPQQVGPLIGNRKSISEIIVNLYNTQHILINGFSPFKQTLSTSSSSTTIDKTPESHTGRFRMIGFRGWDDLGQITITQDYPYSMTLLNLGFYFNFGK